MYLISWVDIKLFLKPFSRTTQDIIYQPTSALSRSNPIHEI